MSEASLVQSCSDLTPGDEIEKAKCVVGFVSLTIDLFATFAGSADLTKDDLKGIAYILEEARDHIEYGGDAYAEQLRNAEIDVLRKVGLPEAAYVNDSRRIWRDGFSHGVQYRDNEETRRFVREIQDALAVDEKERSE